MTPRARKSIRILTSDIRSASTNSQTGPTVASRKAMVALGSNVGDRVDMIEKACRMMDKHKYIRITRTSSLWETKPMYVTDQGNFVNGVCEIETSLGPAALLHELQGIENALGRVKTIDKGPRSIDLDILLYHDTPFTYSSDSLKIPHPLMLDREFVLRPLCELIPNDFHPYNPSTSYRMHLARLPPSNPAMSTLTPLARNLPPLTALNPSRRTRTMSIINQTPDSFSDGGAHSLSFLPALMKTLRSHIDSGATIIDLGGQSSRPNAVPISSEEEISRITPALNILNHWKSEARDFAISIDTYRSTVARAAVAGGADIINDISAGQLDPEMLPTMAELGCTVCLMHMRGTPETMMQKQFTTYPYPQGVVAGVAKELLERVEEAQRAGIRRWRIVLDPGLGFAKTAEQSLELVRNFKELREWPGLKGLPWLLGPSRKGFVGMALGGRKDPMEREWGTAAMVAACVQGGADVVRVHKVPEMVDVVRVSDAIYRAGGDR
ncbi:MAG: trifunctional dihydropteroate synthetase [Bogoriella megaspora]|nr:MAG: trifunctional dihydropteroate synthetase [Bogoriella megaspora]